MNYVPLGRAGVKVSPLCLGCMNFGDPTDEKESIRIFCRYIERNVLPFCQKHGFATIPWSPLAGGWLAGKYRRGQQPPPGSRGDRRGWDMDSPINQKRLDAVEELIPLARDYDATLSQFALAWALKNQAVTSPIIGPRTMDHLDDNLGALQVGLDQEGMERVDEIVPPKSDLMGIS